MVSRRAQLANWWSFFLFLWRRRFSNTIARSSVAPLAPARSLSHQKPDKRRRWATSDQKPRATNFSLLGFSSTLRSFSPLKLCLASRPLGCFTVRSTAVHSILPNTENSRRVFLGAFKCVFVAHVCAVLFCESRRDFKYMWKIIIHSSTHVHMKKIQFFSRSSRIKYKQSN